jgi:predicted permease
MLEGMTQDLTLAVRSLVRRPGYALAASTTLALGIGASTALFSVVNGVLLAPLGFPAPERLVRVFETDPSTGRADRHLTVATFVDVAATTTTLAGVAAYQSGWEYVVDARDGAGARLIPGARVLPNTLALLGVPAALGRTFAPEGSPDDGDGAVIGYAVWQEVFHGDPGVVGRRIDVDGAPHTILGVMPEGFGFPNERVGVWRPYVLSESARANRRSHTLDVVARLAPSAGIAQAQRELSGIMARLGTQFPNEIAGADFRVVPLRDATVGDTRSTLLMLFGAVLVLLAIACANVAGLGVIRGWARDREVAVRSALGAGRGRIARTLLAESLVVAVVAGVAGAVVGWWSTTLLLRLAPLRLPRQDTVAFDLRVLGFVVALTIAVALAVGFLPVLRAAPTRLVSRLKQGGHGATARRRSVLDGLVAAEVALSVVLLLGAGLVVRSYAKLRSVDPGFDSANVLALSLLPTETRYPDVAAQTALYDRVLERVTALPGVGAAGVITELPLSGPPSTWSLLRPGRELADDQIGVIWNPASPGYFAAVGLPLLHGRLFDARDHADATPVLVIDAASARRFFGDDDPIGAQVRTSPTSGWYTVIGVVGSVRHESLRDEVQFTMYSPYAQNLETWRGSRWLLVRADGAAPVPAAAVRQAVLAVDPGLAVARLEPFADVIDETLALDRFRLLLLAAFATAAVGLVAVGLYGTLTYVVVTRARELALRCALGATPGAIAGMVLTRAAAIAGAGVGAGLLAGASLGGLLESALFGVTVLDPATQVGVTGLVAGVVCLASLLPALRAATLPPGMLLRAE